jgi:hypothetical protein
MSGAGMSKLFDIPVRERLLLREIFLPTFSDQAGREPALPAVGHDRALPAPVTVQDPGEG